MSKPSQLTIRATRQDSLVSRLSKLVNIFIYFHIYILFLIRFVENIEQIDLIKKNLFYSIFFSKKS